MKELTSESFKKEICTCIDSNEFRYLGDKPAIIDFYAEWCGPCKVLAPTLEALEKDYEDVNFYKMNVDYCSDIVEMMGIQSVPTMLFILDKNESPTVVRGSIPKDELDKIIKDIFKIEVPDVSEF